MRLYREKEEREHENTEWQCVITVIRRREEERKEEGEASIGGRRKREEALHPIKSER